MNQSTPDWFRWVAISALAGYALFIGWHTTVAAAGPDSSGYMNSARLFSEGKFRTPLRVPAEFGTLPENERGHFTPFGFKLPPGQPDLVPSYPSGLPLHFAAAGKLLGWQTGPYLVQLLAAIGAVGLCYLAARELGLDPMLAAAGTVMLAAFPVFIFTSIQTLSDTLGTTWTLAAVLCALRARRHPWWSIACGAALAIAVLVRPTNLLLAPGLIVLLGRDVRRLGWFVLGGLPGALWLGWYNHEMYGGVFRSGYGNSFAGFALQYGPPTVVHFAKWLAAMLPTIVLALPFVALGRRNTRSRELAGLALIAAANIGLYVFYDVSRDVWWCLRFILPGAAALILAGLLGVEAIAGGPAARWRHFRVAMAAGLIGWAAIVSWYWIRSLHVLYVPIYERAYRETAELVRERLPANALVVCSPFCGAIYYYTAMPTLLYDHLAPDQFARYTALARGAGRPIYAVIFEAEEEEVLRTRCPGNWKRIAQVRNIGVWHLQ